MVTRALTYQLMAGVSYPAIVAAFSGRYGYTLVEAKVHQWLCAELKRARDAETKQQPAAA